MQAAVLYYRTTKHHTHIAAWQFIELASGLAEDIGIGGPKRAQSLVCPAGGPYVDSSEAWRTWLVCHMQSATVALFMRKPNTSSWDARDTHGLEMLENSYFRADTDELLGQLVRAEHLCDAIATQQRLYDSGDATLDVSEPGVQLGMQRLMNSITDWKAQIPMAVKGPAMDFWESVAILYLHEPVLHTATNKSTFSAPYIAPRISVTDFPRPLVTPEHIASIHQIRHRAHVMLNMFEAFDRTQSAAMPAMYFPGRVAYAAYLLAKLYVAVTAPGNTFGAFILPESLQLDQYLDRMAHAHSRMTEIDEFCGQARILSAVFKLREWYHNYKANYLSSTSGATTLDNHLPVSSYDTMPMSSAALPVQWSNMAFIDNQQSLGLEDFFADPSLTDWFPQPYDPVPLPSTGPGPSYY